MALHLNKELNIQHLSRVRFELFDMRDKWYTIGTDLGLSTETLDNIKRQIKSNDPSQCLLRMLIEWLNARDLCPSWQKLSEAIQRQVTRNLMSLEAKEMEETDGLPPLPPVETLSQSTSAILPPPTNEETSPLDKQLSTDNLQAVRSELFEAQLKWYDIGLELGLPWHTLEKITQECQDTGECLRKMILEWLRAIDLKPTWRSLLNVLQRKVINEGALAVRVMETHGLISTPLPNHSPSPTPSQPTEPSQLHTTSPTQEDGPQSGQNPPPGLQIKWKKGPKAPTALDITSCTMKDNIIYYYCATTNEISEYNLRNKNGQSQNQCVPRSSSHWSMLTE